MQHATRRGPTQRNGATAVQQPRDLFGNSVIRATGSATKTQQACNKTACGKVARATPISDPPVNFRTRRISVLTKVVGSIDGDRFDAAAILVKLGLSLCEKDGLIRLLVFTPRSRTAGVRQGAEYDPFVAGLVVVDPGKTRQALPAGSEFLLACVPPNLKNREALVCHDDECPRGNGGAAGTCVCCPDVVISIGGAN